MSVLQRITRQPAAVLAVVTTGLSLAVMFGAPVTAEQAGGVGVFVGALIGALQLVTSPYREVIAKVTPDGEIVAGPAALAPTGTELWTVDDDGVPDVRVGVTPALVAPEPGQHRGPYRNEGGATTVQAIGSALLILVAAAVLFSVAGALR